jgi:hypothetical protein
MLMGNLRTEQYDSTARSGRNLRGRLRYIIQASASERMVSPPAFVFAIAG